MNHEYCKITHGLRSKIGTSLIDVHEPVPGKLYIEVEPKQFAEASCWVKENLGRALCHYRRALTDGKQRAGIRLPISFPLMQKRPSSASPRRFRKEKKSSIRLLRVPAANWSEREVQDLIGIKVQGHPDPRRLVVSDDWPEDIYPLRKDVPHNIHPPAQEGVAVKFKEPPEGCSTVVMGPFYPVLEEPAQLRLFVEGERIVDCDYRGFYNHRGIEKLGDSVLTYNEVPFVAERICGICGFVHSCCYCEAVEEAAKVDVPARANICKYPGYARHVFRASSD